MEKIWTIKKADEEFSKFIRKRDGRCMHPRCNRRYDTDIRYLQCSHYWERGIWPLRYDPDNCDAAHPGCHKFKWENDKAGGYMDFKIQQLGRRRFNAMRKKAMDYKNEKTHTTKRMEIIKVMKLLKNVDKN